MTSFDAWCAQFPGLHKSEDGMWTAAGEEIISFPMESHASLAAIELKSYWFKHRNIAITSVVKRFPPAGPILDVGGGNGFVSLGLREAGFSAFVIEPGAVGARICANRDVPVIQAAFQDIEFGDDKVDAIGVFDVLEHIEDDERTLERFYRLLKPGGMLYVAVPAYNWLWSYEDVAAGHFRRYTLTGLCDKLAKAGFAVEYRSHVFAVLVLPLLLLRSIPSKLGLRAEVNAEQSAREHSLPDNIVGRLIQGLLSLEQSRIVKGGRVPFGTSCLVAARTTKSLRG